MSQASRNRLEGKEGQDFARNHLVQIVVDDVNWKILHRDSSTGDYWKEYFPQSEMHGGGPSVFEKMSKAEAAKEFNIELK